MGKISVKPKQGEMQLSKIKKAMGEDCACFVLISCSAPSSDGKMNVEMNYEGDESLAAFLVENAAQVFDDRLLQRESK